VPDERPCHAVKETNVKAGKKENLGSGAGREVMMVL
jgi:hypothetical protein